MPKKINFDKAIKKVENISSKIDIIMRNGLVIAFFLIIDGITFILNPDATLPGMAKNIMLLVIFAAFSVLIANLSAKTKDTKTIIISLAIIILGIIFYFYPDFISAYIQLLLALFIIYNGLKNISGALNLNKLSKYTQAVARRYHKITSRKTTNKEKEERREKFKEVDNNINEELEQQKKKLITPLENIIGKTSKFSKLYIATNVASVIFGIILLVFPSVSMTVWGIIFLYTGIPNLLAAAKTMELTRKIKERKFKEILFDKNENEKNNKSSKSSKNNKPNKDNKSNKKT